MKTLAIICQKTSYLQQIGEAMPRYLPREWVVMGFSNEEEFVKEAPVNVLLAMTDDQAAFKERNKNRAARILFLVGRKEVTEGEVFMYRSASVIAEIVMQKPSGPQSPEGGAGEPLRIYGYAAAEGGSGCTTEAFKRAVTLSTEGKTAFLSLDSAPGIREFAADGTGLSELIYLLKEYREAWTAHLGHCAQTVGNAVVFAGVARLGDERGFNGPEAKDFITGLRQAGFRFLIFDFGKKGTDELLGLCERIYFTEGKNAEKRNILLNQSEEGDFRERVMPLSGLAEGGRNGIRA